MAGDDRTAAAYASFARVEAAGESPTYEALCARIAADEPTLAWLRTLPPPKRQPNLLLGALRLLDAPLAPPQATLTWIADHHDELATVIAAHRTQTNEVGRCAPLALALAHVDGPLALVEIGASAGLNLLLDRYAYDFGDGQTLGPADAPLTVTSELDGLAAPTTIPRIGWRAGLDLNPLDATDPDVRAWLGCLVWPEHADRRARLDAALAVAAADPPRLERGDATTELAALLTQAPAELTLVVVHTATLVYLDDEQRAAVLDTCAAAGARRIGLESPGLMPGMEAALNAIAVGERGFALTLDDETLAVAHPHGRWIRAV